MSKLLWDKKKLLIKSNFSYSHRISRLIILQTNKNQGLLMKGLDLVQYRSENNLTTNTIDYLNYSQFFFYTPALIDLGHIVLACLFVCPSVCLSAKSLTKNLKH